MLWLRAIFAGVVAVCLQAAAISTDLASPPKANEAACCCPDCSGAAACCCQPGPDSKLPFPVPAPTPAQQDAMGRLVDAASLPSLEGFSLLPATQFQAPRGRAVPLFAQYCVRLI